MNELSVTERQRVVGLLRLGWSERRVAREAGCHRLTVRRIAQQFAIEPEGVQVALETGATAPSEKPATSRSSCGPHRTFIEVEFGKGRNAMAIFRDLVEHHGYEGSYNAV